MKKELRSRCCPTPFTHEIWSWVSLQPYKPPSIMMLTPSGRFKPATRICLSMSDFHPESWNPMWGVRLILLGLQSFFYEDGATTGALQGVPAVDKRLLAAESLAHNVRNPTFRKLFPDLVELHQQRKRDREQTQSSDGGHQTIVTEAPRDGRNVEQRTRSAMERRKKQGHHVDKASDNSVAARNPRRTTYTTMLRAFVVGAATFLMAAMLIRSLTLRASH